MNRYYLNIFLMIVLSFLISAILMPLMIKLAKHIGAMDIPRDDRRAHNKPMPKLGGLGIFLAFLISYMLFGNNSIRFNSILIGAFFIIITGLIDDINAIKSYQKFIGQIAAALTVILYGNILLEYISVFGYTLHFGFWSYPITLVFILACINIINLIDGLDGLSSGISSIFFFTITVISIIQNRFGTLEITLSILMLGSCLGFLKYNFYPAKIFAGDAGAMFMGYMVAVISLLGFKGALLTSLAAPLLVLAVPILDTAFAIIRRIFRRQAIYEADKDHFHHQFLKMNFSHRNTVLIIYLINLFFSLVSILMLVRHRELGLIMYAIIFIGLIWFVRHTSIIKRREK